MHTIIIPILKMKKLRQKKLSILPKVTQLMGGRTGSQTQVIHL